MSYCANFLWLSLGAVKTRNVITGSEFQLQNLLQEKKKMRKEREREIHSHKLHKWVSTYYFYRFVLK